MSRTTTPPLPGDCRRILVVGAGGFARELVDWFVEASPEADPMIRGHLAEEPGDESSRPAMRPLLGSPADFELRPGDYLLLGIGRPDVRRRVGESLLARGGRFLTTIHPTAIVTAGSSLGVGTVVCPYAIVSSAATIGRFVLMNYFSSVAHDSVVEDFSVLSPYAAVAGAAAVGQDCFLGMHATVAPGVTVGAGCRISSLSWARVDAPAGSLIHGNPPVVRPLVAPMR